MKLLQFIVQKTRVFPTYYRVGYFGKGFENSDKKNSIGKLFIYKGQLLEQLTTFVQNLKNKYPKSTIDGAEPTEEQKNGNSQYIQVAKLNPSTMELLEGKNSILNSNAPDYIKIYKKNYDLTVFFSEKSIKKGKDKNNEFKGLWVKQDYFIVDGKFPTTHRKLPVIKHITKMISPIQCAINTILNKNNSLKMKILYFSSKEQDNSQQMSNFTMELNGTIDAAVNGGVFKYQEAFLTPEYLQENPDNIELVTILRTGLREQLHLLDKALNLHDGLVTQDFRALHSKMKDQFRQMKTILGPILAKKKKDEPIN
ncbi:dedicator of cytokinesis [Anaeramoeba flamelloides]|uniref:Dedicator of cytokinesis n=1 Tax=Anaeramoeba flamelloides TaxID=1746091 RepID=A0ABQ8XS08_9EUKA|nr:dedicator of cytokinesis [Anaeramoeba flamelloides]